MKRNERQYQSKPVVDDMTLNLTSLKLNKDKTVLLKLQLKHNILLQSKEFQKHVIVENIWEQIETHGMLSHKITT